MPVMTLCCACLIFILGEKLIVDEARLPRCISLRRMQRSILSSFLFREKVIPLKIQIIIGYWIFIFFSFSVPMYDLWCWFFFFKMWTIFWFLVFVLKMVMVLIIYMCYYFSFFCWYVNSYSIAARNFTQNFSKRFICCYVFLKCWFP